MKRKTTAKWWVIVASLLALIAFVGCDLAGYDIAEIEAESRKVKPVTVTESVDPPETIVPTIYWGNDDELLFDPAVASYEYLEGYVYQTVPASGIVDPPLKLYDNDGLETHEYVGYRFLGYLSSDYGFWAGQHQDAGTVNISNDGVNFFIEIDTNGAADVAEYHFFGYSSLEDIPSKRPSPGQAPFKLEHVDSDNVVATIPFEFFGATADTSGSYYFIIHAALVEEVDGTVDSASLAGETAYAAGGDTPVFDGKGSWFYIVGYTVRPYYELIYKPIETDDDDDEVIGSFPELNQDISNVVLIFDLQLADDNDGYYTVKFEGFGGGDVDLDDMIDDILAYLVQQDDNITSSDAFLGAVIKSGEKTVTLYYEYGTGDEDPDDLPAGIGFTIDGTTNANVNPTNAIDVTYDYGNVR